MVIPQVVHHNHLKPYLPITYQLGHTVSDALSPIGQTLEKGVPSTTSSSSAPAVQENLPSVVFAGGVPNRSLTRSLVLGQLPLSSTQNTGQFNVSQPDNMDTVTSEVGCSTDVATLDSRPLGCRPVKLPAKFEDYVVK